MDIHTLFIHSLDIIASYVQRFSMMALSVIMVVRLKSLNFEYFGTEDEWRYKLKLVILFGVFAIISTHSGTIFDIEKPVNWSGLLDLHSSSSLKLKEGQAVISFRDTMVIMAGLVGGVQVGFGAGIIAGMERWYIGGFVSLAACVATIAVGICSGFFRNFRPNYSWCKYPFDIIFIAISCSIIQRLLILFINDFDDNTMHLSMHIAPQIFIINIIGCLLFRAIEREINPHKVEEIRRTSELKVLRSTTEPHFLTNALTSIHSLVIDNPEKSREYIIKLTDYFQDTRDTFTDDYIALAKELENLDNYIHLNNLTIAEPIDYSVNVDDSLKSFLVPSWCLNILTENAFKYNFRWRESDNKLIIDVKEKNNNIIIRVKDNGFGIKPEILPLLGNSKIDSTGGGIALYHLNRTLKLAFGKKATLEFYSVENKGTEIIITLPKRKKPWQESNAWYL